MSDFEPHHISPESGNKPGYISSFSASAQGRPHTPTLPHISGLASKKRRMSKAKGSPILKRAVSTPQMSGLLPHETGGLSPSALDKRRNKLGYQRISIACGHCRRRKIRCVLSETDELGRCQNCIRLKKECVFYPVDSAGGAESRAQQKSGLGSKASSVISNSPSERKPGAIGESEREHEFGRFPPLASNAPSDLTSISSGSGLGISTGTSMTTPEFGFDSGASARDGWHAAMYQQPDSATSEASTTGSWRVQDSPRVGDFSGFSSSDGQPGGVYGGYHYPPPRAEYGMQPPLRSMSYGNIEPSLGGFQPPAPATPVEFARPIVPTQFTLPSVDTTHAPTTSAMLDPAIAPVATESIPQYGAMYSPTQWSYYQQPSQSSQHMGMDYNRHDSLNMQWYHPGQMGMDEQNRQHQQRQQQQQQHHHQQQQWQHQQQQQQQQHHNLMPPPGSGYSKGHSPG